MKKVLRWWPHLFVIAAVLLITRQWWNPDLLGGHSSDYDFFRQVVLDDAIRQGNWWPRFNELFYFGYGSLLFHFYAPLSYYLTEIFVLLGSSIAIALKLAMATSLFLSGFFMVLLVRELFGNWAAACAGALYVLAPYHLVDVLARHAFGEAVAFTWLPLIFWGLLGAMRDRSAPRMIAGAIGFAFLILSHNITAMITAPFLFFWWLFLAYRYRANGFPGMAYGALVGIFGLMLSAFFWVPALLEKDLVWSERSLIREYFTYSDHFVYFKQFFSTFWGHGGSRIGIKDDHMSFQIGLAHWLLLTGSLVVVFKNKKLRNILLVVWGLFIGSMAMTHFVSKPIWDTISLLAFVQFPWRFLVLTAFFGSIAAGAVAEELKCIKWNSVGPALALCAICLPFVFYAPFTYSRHTLMLKQNEDCKLFQFDEYREKLKSPRYRRIDETISTEWIRTHFVRATSRDDFLPKAVRSLPTEPPQADIVSFDGLVVSQKRIGPTKYRAEVVMEDDGKVLLQRFWYPGWEAKVDGRSIATKAVKRSGVVGIKVPSGEHDIEFEFGTTTSRLIYGFLSLITAFALLLWLFLAFGKALSKTKS